MNETTLRVCKVVAESLGVDSNKVTVDTTSDDYEEWDSLVQLSIMEGLVEEFGEALYQSTRLNICLSVKDLSEEIQLLLLGEAK